MVSRRPRSKDEAIDNAGREWVRAKADLEKATKSLKDRTRTLLELLHDVGSDSVTVYHDDPDFSSRLTKVGGTLVDIDWTAVEIALIDVLDEDMLASLYKEPELDPEKVSLLVDAGNDAVIDIIQDNTTIKEKAPYIKQTVTKVGTADVPAHRTDHETDHSPPLASDKSGTKLVRQIGKRKV